MLSCTSGDARASSTSPIVLMLGLDGGALLACADARRRADTRDGAAGKTKLLYHMKLGPLTQLTRGNVDFEPTAAMNYEVVKVVSQGSKFHMHVWDLSGNVHLRSMWQHYCTSVRVDAVFFVVDANDKARFDEAREALQQVLHSPALAQAVKLVILNVKGADAEEQTALAQHLGVPEAHRSIRVFEVNPEDNNRGVQAALEWVCHRLVDERGIATS